MSDGLVRETPLHDGWLMASCAPNAWTSPQNLPSHHAFYAAKVPATVACVPGANATLAGRRTDELDHWYRLTFHVEASTTAQRTLCFDGLATLAEVWLDGQRILQSDNMFVAHRCDVTQALAAGGEHELCLRFGALLPVLTQRRPRGRWPARLISQKNLRFVRTSLLGYMPGWFPERPPVGPWRPIRLVEREGVSLSAIEVRTRLDGDDGVVSVRARVHGVSDGAAVQVVLSAVGHAEAELKLQGGDEPRTLSGELRVEQVQRWWPHTHGTPTLYALELAVIEGAERNPQTKLVDLGSVGFRTVALDRGARGDGFALRINDREVFCRGACWSPLDADSIVVDAARYRQALSQVRDAGFNMLRISGVMAYEATEFYALCDELGLLVWQDFMFANLDYPIEDAVFSSQCQREAEQVCERLAPRPCLAVMCGGSEVLQQAAMMGIESEQWRSELFDRLLPDVLRAQHVDVPYVPSSPSGGALPFHVNAGVGHYYGVGAYRRPLDDVRIADVKFASECLAFSNVPEPQSLRRLGDAGAAPHTPQYKAAVPRDTHVGWDFADVTDHYIAALFDVDVRALRFADPERYLALSRVSSGEVMATVMRHFRRHDSGCRGALVWLLRDPMPGAGWGVIDSDGVPKAAYYFLKRAWSARAMWLSDEGVNGLALHIDNATHEPLDGAIEVSLIRDDGGCVERATQVVHVDAFGQTRLNVEGVFGRFVDASYAYRFGPPGHRVVVARWLNEGEAAADDVPAPAFHVIDVASLPRVDTGLSASVTIEGDRTVLTVVAQRFAQAVAIEIPGCEPSDNYFHLAPGVVHKVTLRFRGGTPASKPYGAIAALNSSGPSAIAFPRS